MPKKATKIMLPAKKVFTLQEINKLNNQPYKHLRNLCDRLTKMEDEGILHRAAGGTYVKGTKRITHRDITPENAGAILDEMERAGLIRESMIATDNGYMPVYTPTSRLLED